MADHPHKIFLGDLTHTGVTIDANIFPLGCGYIAAYCRQELGEDVSVDVFRYPDELSAAFETATPEVAGFANYSWSFNLNYAYAERVKAAHPETVTIFGGPNYPVAEAEQATFLKARPAIDFYVDGEGEVTFVALYRLLAAENFAIDRVKAGPLPAGVHCLVDGEFRAGPPQQRITDVSILPSPYLSGVMDKFFDNTLTPLLQTSRGCPYSCAYCHDGVDSMNKLARFPQERINAEIRYVLERRRVPVLALADSNFGIFKEDLETARLLADLRQQFDWPHFIDVTVAKHAKQRVIEIGALLKGSLWIGASVQSTDGDVLDNIKRRNVPLDQMVDLAKASAGGYGFSEVILNLPGDTREKHMQSVMDMLDLGMDEVRMYQFILLPGTDAASEDYYRAFGYQTRYRVLPRCFGRYSLYGHQFNAFEYHEVCVGSYSMPIGDYSRCRAFDLTVEIFNNGGVLRELFALLGRHGIHRSQFLSAASARAEQNPILIDIFRQFIEDENKNFYPDLRTIQAFLAKPEAIEKYRGGELGTNQMFWFRSVIFCDHFDTVVEIAATVASELLTAAGAMSAEIGQYLEELKIYLLSKKGNLLSLADIPSRRFNFDFVAMEQQHFLEDPTSARRPDGIEISFVYSDSQREHVAAYYNQFGRNIQGFAHYLQRGGPLSSLFRAAVSGTPAGKNH